MIFTICSEGDSQSLLNNATTKFTREKKGKKEKS